MDRAVIYLGAVCFAFVFGGNMFAQNSTSQDLFEAMLRQESSEKLTPEEIQDIVEIRSRLGGGTGLELEEVLISKYTELTEENPPQYFPKPDIQDQHAPTAVAEKLFWQMLDSSQKDHAITESRNSSPVKSLRSIARRIEELAADLEELELFDNADELRLQATKVRTRSREHVRRAATDSSFLR